MCPARRKHTLLASAGQASASTDTLCLMTYRLLNRLGDLNAHLVERAFSFDLVKHIFAVVGKGVRHLLYRNSTRPRTSAGK